MAPHSSTLAWKIPWMEEPGRLQSMGSLRVGHDWVASLSLFTHALEKEMATHSSVLAWRIPGTGKPDGLPSMGSQSRTRLKWLSIYASCWVPITSCSSKGFFLCATPGFLFSLPPLQPCLWPHSSALDFPYIRNSSFTFRSLDSIQEILFLYIGNKSMILVFHDSV